MIVLDLDKNKPAMVLDLTKELPLLKNLRGTLGWDPHPLYQNDVNKGYDLDIFLFGTNSAGKVKDQKNIAYFNENFKHHYSGAYSVPVDNQTGTDVDGEDDEYFLATLEKMPADIDQLHVYVFIHQAEERGQNFGMVSNARFDIVDEDTGKTVVRYQVTTEFKDETALHVATIARNKGGWEIRPVGVGVVAGPNEVLSAYL